MSGSAIVFLTLGGRLASAQVSRVPTAVTNPSAAPELPGLSTGEHNVIINGVRLWYRVAGASAPGVPPVVFLHGGPGYNSHSFAVLEGPRLEHSLRMVYFDQRGSGHSERPWSADYAMDTLVEDVEGLRRALGVPEIALIGHSFGGMLALEYAAKYPERVSRMVFVDGLSDGPATCHLLRQQLATAHPDALARAVADTTTGARATRSDCDLAFRALRGVDAKAFLDGLQFHDSTFRKLQDSVDAASGLRNTGEQQGALISAGLFDRRFAAHERLTMPVLVLAGRYDGVIGVDAPRELARTLPNARFVEYERSAHFPYLEEPDRFARDVIAFLTAPRN